MQVKHIWNIFSIGMAIILLSGCASDNQNLTAQDSYLKNISYIVQKEKEKRIKEELNTESYHFMVTPIVGSEQDDSKVIVDMGKILKVWIAPYVVGGTMIAAHSIYTWVQAPHFIAGESVGRGSPTDASLLTPSGNYPVIYRPDELYYNEPSFSNKELKEYVNKKYEVDKHPEKYLKRIDKRIKNKYDKVILQYLKQQQQRDKK